MLPLVASGHSIMWCKQCAQACMCKKNHLVSKLRARTQIIEQLVVNLPEHQVYCLADIRADVHPQAVLPALIVVQLELSCGDDVAEERARGQGRRREQGCSERRRRGIGRIVDVDACLSSAHSFAVWERFQQAAIRAPNVLDPYPVNAHSCMAQSCLQPLSKTQT